MNEIWYDKMKDFYLKLDEVLKNKVKDCAGCDKCCAHAELPYREIELDFVFEHLFRVGRVDLFEELCNLQSTWGKSGITCMFHKRDGKRCIIYDARTYNCRVFGPYKDEIVGLPSDCVYAETSISVPREKVLDVLPLFREYHALASEYMKYQNTPDEGSKEKNS